MADKIKEPGFYHTKIKDWPEDERPREKLLKHGSATLSDAELIAILLRSGTGSITALDLAKSLLVRYEDIRGLSGRDVSEFEQLKGIGSATAVTLNAAFEIGRRIASSGNTEKFQAVTPQSLAEKYMPLLETAKQEEFRVINLDTANRIVSESVITRGSLNASIVHPREVYRKAISESAAGIIVMHNHPSGNVNPSAEDRKVTAELAKAGKIVGIELIDHIIIAGKNYYSFADHGEIS